MATILWFGVENEWIYYVVLAGYVVLVGGAVWLLSRHSWLPVLLAFVLLLDGMTALLLLFHRWWMRRLGNGARGA